MLTNALDLILLHMTALTTPLMPLAVTATYNKAFVGTFMDRMSATVWSAGASTMTLVCVKVTNVFDHEEF